MPLTYSDEDIIVHWLNKNPSYKKGDSLITRVKGLELESNNLVIAKWWDIMTYGNEYILITNQLDSNFIRDLVLKVQNLRIPIIRCDLQSKIDKEFETRLQKMNDAVAIYRGYNN